MKKKFTMLLASLLCFVGVAKADFAQQWTKTTVWQTEGFTAPDDVTTLATDKSFSVAMMETAVNVTSTTIGVTFTWGQIGNCALQVLGVDLVSEGGEVIKGTYSHQAAGGGGAKTYSLTDLTENTVGKLRYFVGYNSNERLNDTGGDIAVVGADRYGLVTLTINYTYGDRNVSSASVQAAPGENYDIPVLTYTKIAACKIGETAQTVTSGACTITVPAEAATISVELANNFPFETSSDYDNATWYVLQIRSNNKKYVVRSESAPYANTTTTPTTEDALWAFVGNPFDGIQVLNKAAGTGKTLALDANNNAVMTEGATTWNITKGNGGFLLRNGNEGINYLHDYNSTLKIWADNGAAADPGSAFVVTSEAEMISLATAALNAQNSLIPIYEEASYYTYSDGVLAEAKTALQGVATPTTILAALQSKSTVESVQTALAAAGKATTAPAAGDIIQLKNKQYGKYLKANDADLTSVESRNDLATLWVVEEGTDGNVKLKNYSTNEYIGAIRQSATVAMVESANAKQFAFTNQADVYAVFKETTGGSYAYGHIAGHNVLVGWEPGANASQWLVSNVCPLSITYLYNGAEVRTSSAIVEKGTVYTVTSPVDFTKPSACEKGEEPLEAVDGVFSFTVTEATTLVVELVDDLPFTKTVLNADGSFPENTAWYVVLQHSSPGYASAWKYDVGNGVTTEKATIYTDNHLWCFAGSKDDLKIYNKAAGKGYSLTNTDPASMVAENAAVWKMVKSAAEASFAGKNPFCLQKGSESSYLNMQSGTLKYWGSKDQGSTIRVIATQPLSIKYMFKDAELADLSVNGLVEVGSTHTIANPYVNNDYVTVACTVNGNPIEAVDGNWSINVTEPTSVIVTITENLPFKTSTDYATANWQYLQMNSASWKYMQKNKDDDNTSSTNTNAIDDRALWAFVGDALNGFKILNKGAEGSVLTVDAVNDGAVAYMKKDGDQTWTIEEGNGGFIIRQGATECLNDYAGGGVMKIWKADASPNGAGSAFRTISLGVTDLKDVSFPGIFTLQAERSPLLYDANAERPIKLSSGMASGINANENDVNQQFMIGKSDTDGLYYLYSVGAAKFVDATLNFTDYPEAVLSFERNEGNSVFPWFVKIDGKYVVPGGGGSAGNKLFHTATPDNDDGKRYRIVNVGENRESAQALAHLIEEAQSLKSRLDELVEKAVAVKEDNSQLTDWEALDAVLADAEAFKNNAPKEMNSLRTIVSTLQETLDGLLSGNVTIITGLGENSEHPVLISASRSAWAVADNGRGMTTIAKLGVAAAPLDLQQQFAIITPDEGENYYIYSVNAKRFVKKNNTLGAQGDAIQLNDASSKGENRRQFQFKGFNLYVNVGGSNQMTIDGWDEVDEGNACEIVQYNLLTFDLEEALDIFRNGADITLTYKIGDEQVSTTTYKKKGETYSFNNPYEFTTVKSCKKDGEDLEATEGTYSFEVTGDANIVVELQDNLPFRYAASYNEIAHWYFMKIRDDGFTYLGYDEEKAYIRANQKSVPADSKDAYTWGFVGNPFDGFSIVNYATGETKVLSAPVAPNGDKNGDQLARMVEVTKEYTGNLVWNIKAPKHDDSKPGVFYIEHPTATSYAFNRQSYDGAYALCYWNNRDTGSAIQVVERGGFFSLSDLKTNVVYALQAERSPLLYDANAADPTKLSSGMVSSIVANENDVNQQFVIVPSETDNLYYLYNVGAGQFVDGDLNFTYYPEPVLSFETYEGTNSLSYPWWVKINGKYVIPGGGGTAGNKLFHTTAGDDDDGKRYRIVNAGAYDASAVLAVIKKVENLVESTADLSNSKIYTVTPKDNATTGVWDVKYDGENATMLAITKFTGNAVDSANSNQQFAFLTVNGEHYLYSYGAKKFVAKNEGGQMLADELSSACRVEFLTSTIASEQKLFPLVVKVGGSQLHSSYQGHLADKGGIITTWDHTESGGNAVAIVAVDGTVDLSEAIAKVEAYQLPIFKSELKTLIDEAQALLDKGYLDTEDAGMLTSAKEAAEIVYNNPTAAALKEQIDLLGEAIATIEAITNVKDADNFKNTYVYTFVTKRGWVGADANSDNLIGTVNSKVDPAPTPSEDNPMFQWAVYKSANENYYLYNIGKGMFMGMPSGETIPFAATPQGQSLTFKRHDNANWADYPIMFSPDNKGAVSQNANAGLFYWAGGWNTTNDDGSNHKVTVVGQIPASSLTAIADAVEAYEAHGEAVQGLREYLNWFMTSYHDAWAPTDYKWRDQAGVNNYTIGLDNALTLEEYYNNAKAVLDAQESTIDALNEQKSLLESVVGAMTINQPEAGKFYRLRCVDSKKYLQSTVNTTNNRLTLTGDMGAAAMFCYHEGALLSYTTGLYMDHRVFNAVGVKSEVTFSEAVNGSKGCYVINVGGSYHIYGAGSDLDSGSGTPDNRNGYNWWLEEVAELPVGISSAGYTTLYAPVALEISEDVDAYVVSEVQSESVLLTKVTGVVPAETALIIKGEEGNYSFGIRTAKDVTATIATNALRGTVAKSLITPENGYTCYVLAKKDEKVGLYKASLNKDANGETVAEGVAFINNGCKVYLPVTNPPAGQAARALMFRFGGTTEIENVETMDNGQQAAVIFDMQGRRIEKIVEKGMYIVNGKKVIFR